MIPFEEVKKYLPHYLSSEAKEDLFKDLKEFPVYLEKKMYSEASLANNIIYQGDGIEGLLVYNPPEVDSRPAPACQFRCQISIIDFVLSDYNCSYSLASPTLKYPPASRI